MHTLSVAMWASLNRLSTINLKVKGTGDDFREEDAASEALHANHLT